MSEHKYKGDIDKKKFVRREPEQEQTSSKDPVEALNNLAANIARPKDIKTLQNTLGNRSVQRMISEGVGSHVLQRRFNPASFANDIREDAAHFAGEENVYTYYELNVRNDQGQRARAHMWRHEDGEVTGGYEYPGS
jgi:hypothetical protein